MGHQPAHRAPRAVAALAAATAAVLTAAGTGDATVATAGGHPAGAGTTAPHPASAGRALVHAVSKPISTTACLKKYNLRCYSPLQYRKAYNLNPLYRSGITGKGRTIVIVDSFGSPTVQHDLDVFSKTFGLPSTTVQIVKWGKVPKFDPNIENHVGWAGETNLDVQYAHAVAPDAKIVLVETAVAETEGLTGFPEMMDAENDLIKKGIGDVISMSFGATENTFPGYAKGDHSALLNLRYAFKAAAARNVTLLAASGDSGATDYMLDGARLYKHRVVTWPSSDPLVTSVGGTQLTLNNSGRRLKSDRVWNDGFGAAGGGVSGIFARPGFQRGVAAVVGNHRGTPDVSLSAAVNGGAWVYSSFIPGQEGWGITGGTSEATPILAGIVALAAQKAHHRLGRINDDLYAMAKRFPRRNGLIDVVRGNNSFAGVKGYAAAKGYDLASGLGTIDATAFVRALARRAR
ncbi:S53 family peptidase [Peterkaempfera bronchialis]|uniref:Protease n=1 Tax=Peterkaempfera bronchialis TaxID=2126346 RepID=A0A345SXW2_9ACTN|nr:S53 family peptidase [Peterkaempfera bronchialis]AXI78567.1 protease [Peterkaempfera bronchialis]